MAAAEKKQYQKVSLKLKLSIIEQITNGQISANHAANKYNISRGSIDYWIKKLSNFEDKSKAMSKNDQIKKIKERIEELEFVKDFQQDLTADFENITVVTPLKKVLTRSISKRDREKKKKPFRIKWFYQCLEFSKQAYYKRIQSNIAKEQRDQIVLDLVRETRKTHHRSGIREGTHSLTCLDPMVC